MGFVKGTDGIASTLRNTLEGSVGNIALENISAVTLTSTANVTGGNLITAGQISATSTITSSANVVGGNITTAGLITAGGNVTSGNLSVTGSAVTIINQGTGNITVAQGSGVTLYLAGNATAGNRTISTFGMATCIKVATDTWFINGTGVA
jgi:hypothetical protein